MSESNPLSARILKSLIYFLLISFAVAGFLYYWLVIWNDPLIVNSGESNVYLVEGKLIKEKDSRKINYIAYEEMPGHLINSFVAMEDARFYHHSGIDLIGVLRAFTVNITSRELSQGGSTITQQLAKNLFLEHSRTLERKLMEIRIALALENKYTKEDILEMYLNQIYFGHGSWGIDQAAKSYFNKEAVNLTLSESALLAGIIQAPNVFAPVSGWDLAKSRQGLVLERMVDLNFITEAEVEVAVKESEKW